VAECAGLHVLHKIGNDVLGLAEDEVRDGGKRLVAGGEQGPSGDDRLAPRGTEVRDPIDGLSLNQHRADHHVVGPPQHLVLQASDVQVHQAKLPLARQHRGDGKQSQRRIGGLAGDQTKSVLEAPERVRRFG